jgi:hypothetical protein
MPLQNPYVLADQTTETYFLYAQNNPSLSGDASPGTMVYQSQNLLDWSSPTKVYTVPNGGWADPNGSAAAAEVHRYGGKYYLFATLQNSNTLVAAAQQAPGFNGYSGSDIWQNQTARATIIAVADLPLGPFIDLNSDSPLTDPALMVVDGTLHLDPDGTPWMVFAQEWIQQPNAVMAAVQLTGDLSAAAAAPIWLFNGNNAAWLNDPLYGTVPPGGSLCNTLQNPPYSVYGPELYRTPNGSLVMLWSGYRQNYTEYVQTQALSVTGNVRGPWQQLSPIVTGHKGHGMIFQALNGQPMLILHNNNDSSGTNTNEFFEVSAARAELYNVAITDNGVQVLNHRGDLDGQPG